MFTRQPSEARAGNAPSGLVRLGQGAAVQPTIGGLDWLSSAARAPGLKRDGVVTPGGASGYPTTLESLSHVADSLHTRRGRCETGEKETLRISTDHAVFSYVVPSPRCCMQRRATTAYRLPVPLGTPPLLNVWRLEPVKLPRARVTPHTGQPASHVSTQAWSARMAYRRSPDSAEARRPGKD